MLALGVEGIVQLAHFHANGQAVPQLRKKIAHFFIAGSFPDLKMKGLVIVGVISGLLMRKRLFCRVHAVFDLGQVGLVLAAEHTGGTFQCGAQLIVFPDGLFRYAQHDGALVLLDFQQTVTGKDLKGLPHRRDRHAQFLRGVFQREFCPLRDALGDNGFPQSGSYPLAGRQQLNGFQSQHIDSLSLKSDAAVLLHRCSMHPAHQGSPDGPASADGATGRSPALGGH